MFAVMNEGSCLHDMWRCVVIVVTSLVITGCASTADFVDLTKEVSDVREQQNELKLQVAKLEKASTDIELQQKEGTSRHLKSRLDALNAKIEAMETVQSALDSELIDLRRDHEQRMRQITGDVTGVGHGKVTENLEMSSDFETGSISCVSADMLEREPDIQTFGFSSDGIENQDSLSPREAFEIAHQDYQAGDYASAIRGFEAFQERFPDAPRAIDVQYLVGASYLEKGDCSRAIAAFENMVETFPQNSKSAVGMWKLSYLYAGAGNEVQARAVLLRLIKQYPLTREAKLARQRLPAVSR